jgi:hypothetical protein
VSRQPPFLSPLVKYTESARPSSSVSRQPPMTRARDTVMAIPLPCGNAPGVAWEVVSKPRTAVTIVTARGRDSMYSESLPFLDKDPSLDRYCESLEK